MADRAIHRVVDLMGDAEQDIRNMSVAEARRLLLSEDPADVLRIQGSFALVARAGERVCLARSLNRPLRYFLAKEPEGPMLVVADRIDAIRDVLAREGYLDQFHPTYTRMAPAHHVTELRLVGCPDPNPTYRRFFDPPRGMLPPDLDLIGTAYVEALCAEVRSWLDSLPATEPIGVLFSGGADSGAVLLCIYHELLARGQSPARLKAFTLAVEGGGADRAQAREFLRRTALSLLAEEVEVPASALDPLEAVVVIEDYKPLDVECATMVLALLEGIRARYPGWRVLADGDGGDENLRDYPIEENPELTIRSVVTNRLLYHEGWGVEALKHSLTYSGGLSRGCVRGYAPARRLGFSVFSPFTAPPVVAVAEAIPFAELTNGSHAALYALKGEVLQRGIRRVLGREFPVFPKRRFQHGAAPEELVRRRFAGDQRRYRRHLWDGYDAS
ncbi:MAG TPA: asparagine synthase-related protein [Gemmatimonadales bacterium]|nr:asparagine synthase-related protein [Gemmatimonadales bacterium]